MLSQNSETNSLNDENQLEDSLYLNFKSQIFEKSNRAQVQNQILQISANQPQDLDFQNSQIIIDQMRELFLSHETEKAINRNKFRKIDDKFKFIDQQPKAEPLRSRMQKLYQLHKNKIEQINFGSFNILFKVFAVMILIYYSNQAAKFYFKPMNLNEQLASLKNDFQKKEHRYEFTQRSNDDQYGNVSQNIYILIEKSFEQDFHSVQQFKDFFVQNFNNQNDLNMNLDQIEIFDEKEKAKNQILQKVSVYKSQVSNLKVVMRQKFMEIQLQSIIFRFDYVYVDVIEND